MRLKQLKHLKRNTVFPEISKLAMSHPGEQGADYGSKTNYTSSVGKYAPTLFKVLELVSLYHDV
jgi:hypothetical protein